MAISTNADLPGLAAPSGGVRRVRHRLISPPALAQHLVKTVPEKIGSSGSGPTRVEYQELDSGETLIRTRSFGDHLIARGGSAAYSAVGGVDTELWQRYVLGQVLPLTASLQGLEVFHAGAVVIEDVVVAVAGPSGSGKSSLAAALVASGAASFFTDDVLALEAGAFELTAFPGPNLIGVPHDRAPTLPLDVFAGPPHWVDEDKALSPVRGERRPLPIGAFIRLSPDARQSVPRFEPCLPDRLMATTFDGVTRAPERLLRLLRVSAMLAADGRARELQYRPGTDPNHVAATLLEHLDLAAARSPDVA
jgi:hypothetical protein